MAMARIFQPRVRLWAGLVDLIGLPAEEPSCGFLPNAFKADDEPELDCWLGVDLDGQQASSLPLPEVKCSQARPASLFPTCREDSFFINMPWSTPTARRESATWRKFAWRTATSQRPSSPEKLKSTVS